MLTFRLCHTFLYFQILRKTECGKQNKTKKIFLEHFSNTRKFLSNLAYIPTIETLSLSAQPPEHFKSILQNMKSSFCTSKYLKFWNSVGLSVYRVNPRQTLINEIQTFLKICHICWMCWSDFYKWKDYRLWNKADPGLNLCSKFASCRNLT